MLDIQNLTRQVLRNCSISDARHAGLFSVCGLALRLRDLYKWERGLEPWVEEDAALVLDWIGRKEEEWEALSEQDFQEILIRDTPYDPFDVPNINAALEPHGLCYGAGYVHALKPTFFLASLEEKRQVEGHPVYVLGKELARDLLTLPALSQDNAILIRKDSARLFLWNQIFFLKKSGRKALRFALEAYGLAEQDLRALQARLSDISSRELEPFIYHEVGEIRDPVFDREIWREILAAFPHSPVELLARTVKDLLADTGASGNLHFIIRSKRASSLGLYVAFLDGLRKQLFPELPEAFEGFKASGDWRLIEAAVAACYDKMRLHAKALTSIFQQGIQKQDMRWTQEEIQRQLLEPLDFTRERGVDGDHP